MKHALLVSLAVLASSAAAQSAIKINGYAGQDNTIYPEMINRFVRPQLRGVTVTYQALQGDYNQGLTTLLASGSAGDLFYLPGETLDTYIATGKVLPLTGQVNTSPFVRSLTNAFTRNGRVYAIPKDFNTLTLVYNKDLFDEAKVAYPNNNDTWSSLTTKLTNLKKALGSDYYGICLAPDYARMGAFAIGAGWKQFGANGKTNLLDPAFQAAFNWYTGLTKDKVGIQPSEISQDWSGGCLGTGKVAVAIEGNWITGFLKDNAPNLKYGTALMPKADRTGKRGNFIYTVGWAVNANSKNRANALKVLNILTGPQVQQYVLEQGIAIPSRTALSNNALFKRNTPEAQNAAAVFAGASDGNVAPYTFGPKGPDWAKPINAALAAALSGQQSAANALRKAQQDMATLQSR
ncbi:extracellular solute-binding protein [Deinococcus planocerae]|uniref:extracellular solute-binding protein n=1 Tax=Deinococcus planocerae TaxID=1737569 RepID=UPI000C7F06CE|nr:extracellular solute-binding protein [Deinococcus planocerae]